MTDRLFQLEQEMQRLKAQAESGLSAAQAYEDTPQTNRLLAIEQSLTFPEAIENQSASAPYPISLSQSASENEAEATSEEAWLDSPEHAMEQLLSGSLEYSNAFVAAEHSTLPAKQELTAQYINNRGLLTSAEVTEIQRLSTGGAAAGPAGTKALTDRGLMDYPEMVSYARWNYFSNWERLPKPTRLQVATYQWNHHNPAAGVDMSN